MTLDFLVCAREAQDCELARNQETAPFQYHRAISIALPHCPYHITITDTAFDISKYSRKLRGSRVGSKQER